MAKLGITAVDVQNAIAEQNVQVAAGKIGAGAGAARHPLRNAGERARPPQRPGAVRRHRPAGRAIGSGAVVRLRDVARVELGALQYASSAFLDDKPTIVLGVFQEPGSNALDLQQACPGQDGGIVEALPQGHRLCDALRHHAVRLGLDARRADHARPSACCSSSPSCSSSCRAGARPSSRAIAIPVSLDRHAGRHEGARLLAQHA